ncbi:hypothetical protein N431DRAFT_491903 [Stipitochalara longipes BDJ]|nr:hypothetical protein N431DRAFT_491903 [Stipitochalara longipes BDJ]
MAKSKNVAWVVFRGRKPGVYHSYEECDAQVSGFSKGRQNGYKTFLEANLAWEEWQRKVAAMLVTSASAAPQQNTSRPWQESLHAPAPWIEPPTQQLAPIVPRPGDASQVHPSSDSWQGSISQRASCYYDAPRPEPLMPGNSNIQRPDSWVYYPQLQSPPEEHSSLLLPSRHFSNLPKPASVVDLTSSPPPEFIPAVKRSVSYMDLTDKLDDEERSAKRIMLELPEFTEARVLTAEERYELDRLEQRPKPKPINDEAKIELSPEQEKVVNMAMRKHNIFLTGAAGCGKTVTLKEILARLKKKKKGGNVQVVAPTGIAALPLEGKTTYSFAGVSDVFQVPRCQRSNFIPAVES